MPSVSRERWRPRHPLRRRRPRPSLSRTSSVNASSPRAMARRRVTRGTMARTRPSRRRCSPARQTRRRSRRCALRVRRWLQGARRRGRRRRHRGNQLRRVGAWPSVSRERWRPRHLLRLRRRRPRLSRTSSVVVIISNDRTRVRRVVDQRPDINTLLLREPRQITTKGSNGVVVAVGAFPHGHGVDVPVKVVDIVLFLVLARLEVPTSQTVFVGVLPPQHL